jgi:hypothetical protein
MLDYETLNIRDTIYEIIYDWIESTIREGWNILREEDGIKKNTDNLSKRIMKSLIQDFRVPVFQLNRLLDLFYPIIYHWIDNILLTRTDFYRDSQKLKDYAITITNDLVRMFQKKEDFIEFV